MLKRAANARRGEMKLAAHVLRTRHIEHTVLDARWRVASKLDYRENHEPDALSSRTQILYIPILLQLQVVRQSKMGKRYLSIGVLAHSLD